MGFNCLKAGATFEEAIYFLPLSSQIFLVLILLTSEGWKAESTLGSHLVVWNTGPLDWKSSTQTTMLRSPWIKIAHYYCISPFPNILTYKHIFVQFLSSHYCMEEVFSLILLFWGCVPKFNLIWLLQIFRWRNLKSSLQLKGPD